MGTFGVEFTEAQTSALNELAQAMNCDKANIIKQAASLLQVALREKRNGNKICVIKDGTVLFEILGIYGEEEEAVLTETLESFSEELTSEQDISDRQQRVAENIAKEILELGTDHPIERWPRLRQLILMAEDFSCTPNTSALLAPCLLDIAIKYRDSQDLQGSSVVYSAIRTGASMLQPGSQGWKSAENRLLILLQPGHPIDTVLVTLKMIGRIFEAQPPEELNQHTNLVSESRSINRNPAFYSRNRARVLLWHS